MKLSRHQMSNIAKPTLSTDETEVVAPIGREGFAPLGFPPLLVPFPEFPGLLEELLPRREAFLWEES